MPSAQVASAPRVSRAGLARAAGRVFCTLCLALIVVVSAVALFAAWYDAQPEKFTVLVGNSMQPTLDTFNVVYWRPADEIHRGDIALYGPMLHRIVLMPGETFEVRHGKITILAPGEPRQLAEPWVVYDFDWDWPRTTLADDAYGILGDNRTDSYARTVYVAHRADLTRKLDRRVFPPWKRRAF